MNKKSISIVSIVLYVFAGLLLVYTVWAAVYSFNYISSMVAQNQVVIEGIEFEIVSFHMSNFGQYFVFAVLLFASGWIVQMVSTDSAGIPDNRNQMVSPEEISDADAGEGEF